MSNVSNVCYKFKDQFVEISLHKAQNNAIKAQQEII